MVPTFKWRPAIALNTSTTLRITNSTSRSSCNAMPSARCGVSQSIHPATLNWPLYIFQGLANIIDMERMQTFSYRELQVLVSGAFIPVDFEDLKQHTVYSGGYTSTHPVIVNFWQVVSTFNDTGRRQLLKFVTSCSRPPLLGFKDMDPPFCIQSAGTDDRLPTASTCMNLLKLPEFPDINVLREKLLYALESGTGFELSWIVLRCVTSIVNSPDSFFFFLLHPEQNKQTNNKKKETFSWIISHCFI